MDAVLAVLHASLDVLAPPPRLHQLQLDGVLPLLLLLCRLVPLCALLPRRVSADPRCRLRGCGAEPRLRLCQCLAEGPRAARELAREASRLAGGNQLLQLLLDVPLVVVQRRRGQLATQHLRRDRDARVLLGRPAGLAARLLWVHRAALLGVRVVKQRDDVDVPRRVGRVAAPRLGLAQVSGARRPVRGVAATERAARHQLDHLDWLQRLLQPQGPVPAMHPPQGELGLEAAPAARTARLRLLSRRLARAGHAVRQLLRQAVLAGERAPARVLSHPA